MRQGVPGGCGGRDRAAPGLVGVLKARESWVFHWTPGGSWGFRVFLAGSWWLLPKYRGPLCCEEHWGHLWGLCLNHPLPPRSEGVGQRAPGR